MKTTVIHHSADFDGIFCREIARHFLGNENVEYIGWDFGNEPLPIPSEGTIYILDLPVDRVFGCDFAGLMAGNTGNIPTTQVLERVIWIDHHKTSIDTHPDDIPGYRIDGVAACRLAWQWFDGFHAHEGNPGKFITKDHFINRNLSEPLAVRLAGEYDVWDKRDPNAEVFQFGLRSQELSDSMWELLLSGPTPNAGTQRGAAEITVDALLENGRMLQRYQQRNDANLVNYRSFMVEWEGLKFLTLNTGSFNSLTFAAKDVPETGHDALMGFRWDGKQWSVSLYHAKHRTELDLSEIAKKHGGGGHRGACGFVAKSLAWLTSGQNPA